MDPHVLPVLPQRPLHVAVFPDQLHYVLTELEQTGESHIASWLPHGRSFKVHDRKAFVATILPCWFRQHKFESFQRQLNIYAFTRICSGPDSGSYYHAKFLRGQPDLVKEMQRMAVKGLGPRQAALPTSSHPNFYAMTPLPVNNEAVDAYADRSLVNAVLESASTFVPAALDSPNGEFDTLARGQRAESVSIPALPATSLLELHCQRARDSTEDLERRRHQQDEHLRLPTTTTSLWDALQSQTPTQASSLAMTGASLGLRTGEQIQSTGNLGAMSTLQLLRLHRLALSQNSAAPALQQQEPCNHLPPRQDMTKSNVLQATSDQTQVSEVAPMGRITLSQAAIAMARSRTESNRSSGNDGRAPRKRNALDVAMLLHEQTTAEHILRAALLNQQPQLGLIQHDQTLRLGVGARYSTLQPFDVESIPRRGEQAPANIPIAVDPLATLSQLVATPSQLLERLLDHRAATMRQCHGRGATLPVDPNDLSASASVDPSSESFVASVDLSSEPFVAIAVAALPFILGRENQVNNGNASTTGTNRHLQPTYQSLYNDDERKRQARP